MGVKARLRRAQKVNQSLRDGHYTFSKRPLGPGMERARKRLLPALKDSMRDFVARSKAMGLSR